jgi:hypothetical protein
MYRVERMVNKHKGGYTPSVMGTLLVSGPVFVGAALLQGKRLIENNNGRMKSRRRVGKQYKGKRRNTTSKRSRR